MIMANRYKYNDIPSLKGRKIFIDANIIIYLFWPTALNGWENAYASIFGSLLKQNIDINVDFIVISEAINRTIRIEYEKHLQVNNITKKELTFKEYRNSTAGQQALEDIYIVISRKVLNKFFVVGKNFTKTDIESYLSVNFLDFNDKAIISMCRENDFVFLTNDKDYVKSDIDILTSNPSLLKK